jgi:hypothetical protein
MLATITEMQGHAEEAIHMYRETLENQETLLGRDHQDTLDTADSLAMALANTSLIEDFKLAEVLLRKCKSRRELVIGRHHPEVSGAGRSLFTVCYEIPNKRWSDLEHFLS